MRNKAITTVAIASAGVLLMTGCTPGSSSGVDAPVVMAIGSDIGNLDPHMGSANDLTQFKNFMYDRLIYLDDNSEMQPWLATEWTSTARTIDMTITDKAVCSDGTVINADVVVQNFERILEEGSTSPLKGGEMPVDLKVTADSANNTVRFETETDFPFLLERVGGTPIICQGGIDDVQGMETKSFGSGAYILESVNAGVQYNLVRNENYATPPGDWGERVSNEDRPKNVTFRIISNETTAANLLLSGELNIARIQGPDRDRVEAAGVPYEETRIAYGELFFNQAENRPTADYEFRLALMEALKLDDLGNVITSNKGRPATSLVTLDPVNCPVDSVTGNLPATDIEGAKKRLDNLGWVVGSDGIRVKDGKKAVLRVIYPTKYGQPLANAVELLGSQLLEVGIATDIQGLDSPGMSAALWDTGDFDFIWNIFTNNSPAPFAGIFTGKSPQDGGQNFLSLSNTKYEELVEKATLADDASACVYWAEAETTLVKNLDAVPFFEGFEPFFFSNVGGNVWKGSVAGWSLRTL